MTAWADQLAEWQDAETSQPVVALVDVAQTKFVLWAFSQLPVEWHPDGEPDPSASDARNWHRAWDFTHYDAGQLAMIANVPERTAAQIMERIIAVRLAYPDGSINKAAKTYLNKYLAQRIRSVLGGD